MHDPYTILGVSKGASAAEIKAAYRKLAKKLHPDANKHDAKAASRFSELNAAYEIVGDDDKRKAFDRGEIDAEGKPRFRGFEGAQPGGGFGQGATGPGGSHFESFSFGDDGFQRRGGGGAGAGGFEDLLRGMFGGRASPGGGARGHTNQFDPEDLGGQGGAHAGGQDLLAALTITLPEAAKGVTTRMYLPTGKEVEVKIPAGIASGQQIRLKGQGYGSPSGRAGDAIITITVGPHPVFKAEGDDLRIELPITLYEAVLGGKVRVPTLDGAVELAIPPDTNAGRTFRLKGKGLRIKGGVKGQAGDLFATVRVVLPEKADDELKALAEKLRDDKPYDPRKDLG